MHEGAGIGKPTIINVPDISNSSEEFVNLERYIDVDWVYLSGLPQGYIEHHFPKVNIARYRAAFQAAIAVREKSILISHLPNMTAAVSMALKITRKAVPHLAFSFNFTKLPENKKLKYFKKVFNDITQFAIFSNYEKMLYADKFDINPDLIQPVMWTQHTPPVQSGAAPVLDGPYLCAIGGEGRDFETLLAAMGKLSHSIKLVIIARPHSLQGLQIPDNVEVLINIPNERVWRIAVDSLGVIIPLKTHETCCGHITLVGAKQLGIPCATTTAYATQEYVDGRAAILSCEPGDVDGLALLLQRMIDESDRLKAIAMVDSAQEVEIHSRSVWDHYVSNFVLENM